MNLLDSSKFFVNNPGNAVSPMFFLPPKFLSSCYALVTINYCAISVVFAISVIFAIPNCIGT